MNKYLQICFIFLLVGITLKFFDAQFIDERLVVYTVFLYLLVTMAISLPFILPKTVTGFVVPVQMIFLSAVMSMLMAYVSWNQSFVDSLVATLPYMVWIVFYYLIHTRFSIKILENIIVAYGCMYVILYFYQLHQAPTVLFGHSLWGDEFTVNRNIVRIIFPGAGVFVLTVFIAITRLTLAGKGKILWLILSVLGVIIPVLQATRTFLVGILLIYLIHVIKDRSLFAKIIFTVVVSTAVIFYFKTTENEIIQGLISASEKDLNLGSDYVRIKSGTFFLTEFSPNYLSRLFGNGVPAHAVSDYGSHMEQLAAQRGFYFEDVGIIGLYAMLGIFGVFGFAAIWYKSFTVAVPRRYYYVKYYLWYLLFSSLTSWNIYIYHFIISTVFVVYIYHRVAFGAFNGRDRKVRIDSYQLRNRKRYHELPMHE